jgi:hypothetical protein
VNGRVGERKSRQIGQTRRGASMAFFPRAITLFRIESASVKPVDA